MLMLLKTMTTGHETDKRRRQVRGREYRDGWICDGWMLTLEWFQSPAIQSSVHVRLLKLSDGISSRLLLIWRRFFRYTPSAACHTLHYLEEEEEEAGNLIPRGGGLFSPVPRKGSLTRHEDWMTLKCNSDYFCGDTEVDEINKDGRRILIIAP